MANIGKLVFRGGLLAIACVIMLSMIYADFSFSAGHVKQSLKTSQQLLVELEDAVGAVPTECVCPVVPAETCSNAAGAALPSVPDTVSAWSSVKYAPFPYVMKRKCIIGSFGLDWDHINFMIENTTMPFAIVRYGDGERNLIQGKGIGQGTQAFSQDKFWFEGGDSELGTDLKWSLTGHFGQQFYYGFASPRDDGAGLHWYLEHTEQLCPFITYANLFVNANYPRTKAMLLRLIETKLDRIALIANYEGIDRFLSLQTSIPAGFMSMSLPDDAPHIYVGEQRVALIANVTVLAKSVTGYLFIVAGGPMAKPLVAHMWNANPTNQYVDFGSSVDEIMKGRITRPYMTPGSGYAEQVDPPFTVDDLDRPVVVNYDYMGG
jgi:hypothetical protein